MSRPRPSVVIWDLGGVLIDWDPRHLYRTLLPDDAAVEAFLTQVCTPAWNHRQDAGRSFADGIAELAEAHPQERSLIETYFDRWDEMLAGPIEGSVAVLDALAERGVRQFALTNWSRETFPRARPYLPFLGRFEGVVVSGEEGIAKPDPELFDVLLARYDLVASACLFVDDSAPNVEVARTLGFVAVHFEDPATLWGRLVAEGLLPA